MKKILLVDDQPNFTKMLSIKLEKMGYQVFSAKNGKIGLASAINEKPNLIVMDIMMPEMDGFTAVEKIRDRDDRIYWRLAAIKGKAHLQGVVRRPMPADEVLTFIQQPDVKFLTTFLVKRRLP